jgi:hypothetical protein
VLLAELISQVKAELFDGLEDSFRFDGLARPNNDGFGAVKRRQCALRSRPCLPRASLSQDARPARPRSVHRYSRRVSPRCEGDMALSAQKATWGSLRLWLISSAKGTQRLEYGEITRRVSHNHRSGHVQTQRGRGGRRWKKGDRQLSTRELTMWLTRRRCIVDETRTLFDFNTPSNIQCSKSEDISGKRIRVAKNIDREYREPLFF